MKKRILSILLTLVMVIGMLPMASLTAHAATNENINTIVIGSHTISALNETDSGTGWTYDGTGTKPVITLTDYNGSGIYIEGNDTATQVGVVINVVGDCNITTNSNGVQLNAAAASSSSLEFQFANNAQLTIKGNIGILHQSKNPITYFVGSGTCNVIAYTSYGLSSTAIATHYNACDGSIFVSNTKLRVTSPEAVKTGWMFVAEEGHRANLNVAGTADVKFVMTGSGEESVLLGHELINPEGFVKNVSSDKKTFELYKYVPQATVTFDANGGTGTMEPVQVPVESLYNPNGNVECGFEAPPHKMFAGWASIEGSDYAISTPITIPSEGKTFYAIWIDDPDEVKVMSFDANGGTGTMEPVQVYVGEDYTPPVTCGFTAPDGMKFVGWSYVLNGPVKTNPITVTENKTFYAVWEPLIDKIDKIDITGLEAPVAGTAPGTPAPTFTPAGKFTVVAEWLTGGSGGIAENFKEDTDYIAFFILTPNEGEAFADGITTSDVTVDKGEVSDVDVAENNGIYIKVKIKSVAGEGGETLPTTYTVTFDSDGGSAVTAQTVESGKTATKPADPTKEGYTFKGWYLDGSEYDFSTPVTGAITLKAKWEDDNSFMDDWYWALIMLHSQKFDITATASEGGEIDPAGVTKVQYSKNITYTITPDAGYAIKAVFVDGKDVGAVSEYTFKNVTKKHTIHALFEQINPYTDVKAGDWFYDDVLYVTAIGLMEGTGNGKFSPEITTDRAMLVTVLWRLEGCPVVDSSVDFDDVADGLWYSDAIDWASANGIVNGYGNGKFGPTDQITREQIAAILNRYAAYKGWTDGIALPMLAQYKCSEWAEDNVIWAENNGLLDGLGVDVSDMTAKASRAELAAYLAKFYKEFAEN